MQFRDVIGQERVKQDLVRTVLESRVSHAQLFLGSEGSGSLALALAYAQFISCEDRGHDDSCGSCASCRKYTKLIHPDLHFSYPFFAKHKDDIAVNFLPQWRQVFLKNPYLDFEEWRAQFDADNKQANINIAECHQIIRKLSLKPFESEYKVLIMWLPEYLDKEGNILLKIIEEPPQKTLFLLVAQDQDQLLNTLLSRVQLVKIGRLSDQDIERYLVVQHGVLQTRAMQIAYLSEGNLQVALSLLNEAESDYFNLFSNWMRIATADKGVQIIDFVEQVGKMGRENQKHFLRYGIRLMREGILLLSGASNLVRLPSVELTFITKFSSFIQLDQAEAIVGELEKAHYHLERNVNIKILFLDVSLHFVKILKFHTLPQGTRYISA